MAQLVKTAELPSKVFPQIIPDDEDFGKLLEKAVKNPDDRQKLYIRVYDSGVIAWIQSLVQINGRAIHTIKAGPMRPFADAESLYGDTMKSRDGQPQEKHPLPLAMVSRGSITRRDWGHNSYPLRNLGMYVDSQGKRRTSYSRHPNPINLPYTIDFHTRSEAHMVWIMEMMEAAFHPLAYHKVSTPFCPENKLHMPIENGGWTDNSDLEPGETSERMLRQSLSIVVQGWKFHDIFMAPTVLRYTGESFEEDLFSRPLADEAPPSLEDKATIQTQEPAT